MAKGSNIQAQLDAIARSKPIPVEPPPIVKAEAHRARATRPASREGLVHVGAWLPEAFARNILLLRAKTGLQPKTIFTQALNDVFRAHNIPVLDEE